MTEIPNKDRVDAMQADYYGPVAFLREMATHFLTQVTRIADAYERSADAAEASVELSRKAVAVQAQLAASSQQLEDSLVAQMQPSNGNSGGKS
jgi:hypothetical protein